MPLATMPGRAGLSPKDGDEGTGGGDLMQDFVRLHMTSILQPFAEGVRELQAQLEQFASELAQLQEDSCSHASRLDQQEGQLGVFSSGAADASQQLEKLQADLASVKKERNRLEGNHEMTKAAVGKTKDMLSELAAAVEELQQSVGESSRKIGDVERGLSESETKITEYMEVRLNKQGKVCRDLNERQAEFTRSSQQVRAIAEAAETAVRELTSTCQQRQRQDAESFTGFTERLAGVEAQLVSVSSDVQAHASGLQSVDRELQHLKTWTEQLQSVKHLLSQQSEAASSMDAQLRRLENVEGQLIAIREDAAASRQEQNNEMNSLEKRVEGNIADIMRWKDTQKAHCDLISGAGQRLADLETAQRELEGRAATSDAELQALEAWRNSCADEQLAVHASALEAVRADVQRMEMEARKAHSGLQDVGNELGTNKELISKLGARLDLCYEYFNGLGKGLQEAHRQIAGSEGMLPPKPGSMLPAISARKPNTPRQGTTPSPRRGVPPLAR